MKHRLATITAAAALALAGATLSSTASARDFFAVSIGAPGFAVGYSNYGHYGRSYVYAAPPVVYAPPIAYYGAPVVYPQSSTVRASSMLVRTSITVRTGARTTAGASQRS